MYSSRLLNAHDYNPSTTTSDDGGGGGGVRGGCGGIGFVLVVLVASSFLAASTLTLPTAFAARSMEPILSALDQREPIVLDLAVPDIIEMTVEIGEAPIPPYIPGDHPESTGIFVRIDIEMFDINETLLEIRWIPLVPTWELELLYEQEVHEKRSWNMYRISKPRNPILHVNISTNSDVPVGLRYTMFEYGPLGRAQVPIAAVLLVAVYILICFELMHRAIAAMLGVLTVLLMLTLLGQMPEISEVVGWVDESTIGLLLGMMIIIGIFSETGFFEFAAIQTFLLSKGKVWRLLAMLCALTALLSAFLDNVTTMLLIAPVTLQLAKVVDLPPVPLLLSEVFFSNIGGAATMVGDPPNIIIGSMLKDITFPDFVIYLAGPLFFVICPATFLLIRFLFRNQLKNTELSEETAVELKLKYQIGDKVKFVKVVIVLCGVILGFFLEPLLHVDPAYCALAGAAVLLAISSPKELEPILEKVEWATLVFFCALFIFVEGLKEMGLIEFIGDCVAFVVRAAPPQQRLLVGLVLIIWVSAFASAFIDNIPYTATMVPVILQLSSEPGLDLPLKPLAMALSLGACLGGNGTLIGASANVVTAGIAHQAGYPLTFKTFMKYGLMVMILSVLIACAFALLIFLVIA